MFKTMQVRFVFALMAVAALALNTGCFTSVAGPEVEESRATASKSEIVFMSTESSHLPEDLNADGVVDRKDLDLFDWTVACDVTGDDRVDIRDAGQISGAMGQVGEGLPEDVNGDGEVNFADLTLYAATSPYSDRIDVDGNGQWTTADRNKIKHAISEA